MKKNILFIALFACIVSIFSSCAVRADYGYGYRYHHPYHYYGGGYYHRY